MNENYCNFLFYLFSKLLFRNYLRVEQMSSFITWEEIVHENGGPMPVFAQPNLINALRANVGRD